MVSTRNSDAAALSLPASAARKTPAQVTSSQKDQGSSSLAKQHGSRELRQSSRLAGLATTKIVDLSDDSESEGNLPNRKRTPRGKAKRQRMTYDEDDSADPDDVQVANDQTTHQQTRAERLQARQSRQAGARQQHDGLQAAAVAGSRYPRRNRTLVGQPESAQGSQQGASSSKDPEEAASDSEQDSEEEEVEEEEEEEEEQEQRKVYQLRERRPIQQSNLYKPSFGGQGSRRSRLLRGSQKSRHVRKAHRPTYAEDWSDDDVLDHPAVAWKSLQGATDALPWENQTAGAGAGPAAAAPGGSTLQPWGNSAPGATSPGQERSGNAEITPLEVDPSVSFDQVGGLEHYIKALKEMVFLPLVYPELFERFHLSPPRGVLFYGPPGTGKTLVARALAATASRAGTKVSFFMRKGADVLSKWVGEAERQLRLLFEEAQKAQPAIIFFDEIDGLAPVRSSKQDQIHNSIVSTLLALMDGLDSRGQVVVIGATNRLDALDGALRRPGRFDRELVFPLPNLQARSAILDIHTRKWTQPPAADLKEDLAHRCVGYCGADLKALCTEASLHALRRQYPQIYDTHDKLLVDPSTVTVARTDFLSAFKAITPCSHRSAVAHARPLPSVVAHCLSSALGTILGHLKAVFPPAAACLAAQGNAANCPAPGAPAIAGDAWDDEDEEDDEEALDWGPVGVPLLQMMPSQQVQRPRLLICGEEGSGQSHLGPALLYALEGLPVHALGLPSLLSDASARSPEEAVVHAVLEARRAAPAILFLPHLQLWWETAPASLRATLSMLLADLPSALPLLLLATADVPLADLDADALKLFGSGGTGIYALSEPTASERSAFFQGIADQLAQPPGQNLTRKRKATEPPQLPRAPEAVAAEEEAQHAKREQQQREEYNRDLTTVTELRRCLRKIIANCIAKSKYTDFLYPMSPDDNPEAYYKVQQHMDLGTLLHHVDHHMYPTCAPFLADVALIPKAWRQYYEAAPGSASPLSREALLMPSKAQDLAEHIQGAVASLPSHLDALCQAIAAKGGPKAPPGMEEEAELLIPSTMAPVAPKVPSDMVARSSKRLRGETVDKQVMFDNPELLARRVRQAVQGDSGVRVVPKAPPSRAVRFQEPLSGTDDASAMGGDEEAEPATAAGAAAEEEAGDAEQLPADGVQHPSSSGRGSEDAQVENMDTAPQEDNCTNPQTGGDSTEALQASSSLVSEPPNTARKVLATSKDSLQKALDIAEGMLVSSAATDASQAVANADDANDAINADASVEVSIVPAKMAHGDKAADQPAGAEENGANTDLNIPSPKRHEQGQEMDPDSSILASTTRPNVPSKLGGKLAQLKGASSSPAPRAFHASSSPAVRTAYAGHTPHPSKSRLLPQATPPGSVGAAKAPLKDVDREGSTPAAALRPFDLAGDPKPSAHLTGNLPYPSSNGAPIEDTPMVRVEPLGPSQMIPDSCVGQMASGSGVDSLHSVAKQSPKSHPIHLTPHLSTVQEEDDVGMTDQADTSGPAAGQAESVLSYGQPTAAEQQGGLNDIDIPQPLPEDLQQAEAFQAQAASATAGMVLDRLEELYSSLTRVLWRHRRNTDRKQVIKEAIAIVTAASANPLMQTMP